MSDVDERGQNKPRSVTVMDTNVVQRLKCPNCGHITKITREWEAKLLEQLDPNYPARRVTIDCEKCHLYQFILNARRRSSGKR